VAGIWGSEGGRRRKAIKNALWEATKKTEILREYKEERCDKKRLTLPRKLEGRPGGG